MLLKTSENGSSFSLKVKVWLIYNVTLCQGLPELVATILNKEFRDLTSDREIGFYQS